MVEADVLAQIGPAVNANKSFLIYGQPGNGKTALAESLFRVETAPIYMPYAIESQGNIIQLYDPIYHQKIEDQDMAFSAASRPAIFPYDGRWFKCRRPFIITGGELTLDMLDLSYNKVSKIYDAPFQLKANNGIYLIDDFGRQKGRPAEVLNRWIVPMERHIDYLSFQAGGKMTVPFEAFLIFSTNLRPDQLGDEAFLRRIQYKMFLRNPAPAGIHSDFRALRGIEATGVRTGVGGEPFSKSTTSRAASDSAAAIRATSSVTPSISSTSRVCRWSSMKMCWTGPSTVASRKTST